MKSCVIKAVQGRSPRVRCRKAAPSPLSKRLVLTGLLFATAYGSNFQRRRLVLLSSAQPHPFQIMEKPDPRDKGQVPLRINERERVQYLPNPCAVSTGTNEFYLGGKRQDRPSNKPLDKAQILRRAVINDCQRPIRSSGRPTDPIRQSKSNKSRHEEIQEKLRLMRKSSEIATRFATKMREEKKRRKQFNKKLNKMSPEQWERHKALWKLQICQTTYDRHKKNCLSSVRDTKCTHVADIKNMLDKWKQDHFNKKHILDAIFEKGLDQILTKKMVLDFFPKHRDHIKSLYRRFGLYESSDFY